MIILESFVLWGRAPNEITPRAIAKSLGDRSAIWTDCATIAERLLVFHQCYSLRRFLTKRLCKSPEISLHLIAPGVSLNYATGTFVKGGFRRDSR